METTDKEQSIEDIVLEIAKAKRRLRISRNIMLICNFVAGLFVIAIYFVLPNVVFIVFGVILLLLNIPAWIVFNKILDKLSYNNFSQGDSVSSTE
jgi:fatty-acid desaturase